MAELTQKDLEAFLKSISKTEDAFALFERVGLYGTRQHLYSLLKSRLDYCLDYLKVDFATLCRRMMAYLSKSPEKKFGAINDALYQDEIHPVAMMIFYALSEPFLLRKLVKQEILYLAFKLAEIKKIFVAGVGCGEIYENIAQVPLLADPSQISLKGVDISKPAIEFCKKRAPLYKINISSEVADLDTYKFSEKYDLVELSEVVEHVREPQQLINKIAGSSKFVLATIPLMLEIADHLHLFTAAKIREMFEEAGLDIVYESCRNSFYVRQFFYFGLLKSKK